MKEHIDLTASEMGYLWTTYQSQTLNWCMLKYFEETAEDEVVKKINQTSLEACEHYLEKIKSIFHKDKFPIPIGFSQSDVNVKAAKLYTDPFILYYQWFISKGNLNFGSIAVNTIARDDVSQFFNDFTVQSLTILNESRKLLLEKGLWIRAPYIPVPSEVSFVEKKSFLNGWIGEQRPLVGQEISATFYNIITNQMGLEFMNSFIQVTDNGKLREYFVRGKDIASKHIQVMSKIFTEAELPVASTWNAGITSSKQSPFSEKLMLNMINFLNAQGMANYGMAISNSLRRDINANFTRLAAEVGKYAEDGTNMLIELGWFEAPPQAPKRS